MEVRWVLAIGVVALAATQREVVLPLQASRDWQTVALQFQPAERLVLLQLTHLSTHPRRAMLTADDSQSPVIKRNDTTGLWAATSSYSDVEGWANWRTDCFLQVNNREKAM